MEFGSIADLSLASLDHVVQEMTYDRYLAIHRFDLTFKRRPKDDFGKCYFVDIHKRNITPKENQRLYLYPRILAKLQPPNRQKLPCFVHSHCKVWTVEDIFNSPIRKQRSFHVDSTWTDYVESTWIVESTVESETSGFSTWIPRNLYT